MKLTIPSTTVKSHFLRTLAINTIYKDPRNSQLYQIQEKKLGNSYVKSAIPYFGTDDYIQLEDIPDKCLKQENTVRGKIMTTMKQRISQLEFQTSAGMDQKSAGMDQNQQTFGPYQQTLSPYQQTLSPYQQTFGPYQQTFGPYQQTLSPYQQTFGPYQQKSLDFLHMRAKLSFV
jgi:hypothetical protein